MDRSHNQSQNIPSRIVTRKPSWVSSFSQGESSSSRQRQQSIATIQTVDSMGSTGAAKTPTTPGFESLRKKSTSSSRRPSIFSWGSGNRDSQDSTFRRHSIFGSNSRKGSIASTITSPGSTPQSRRPSIFSRKSKAVTEVPAMPAMPDIDAICRVEEESDTASIDTHIERGAMRDFWGMCASTMDMGMSARDRETRGAMGMF